VGHPKTIIVGRLNEIHDVVDKQSFDTRVWNLKVTNKHPEIAKTAINCSALIDWDFIQSQGQLLWKTPRKEPDSCNLNVTPIMVQDPTPHLDNRYDKLLGDDYTTKLKNIGTKSSTIPQGSSREIYFLLTIKDHDLAYPIMQNGSNFGSNNDRGIVIQHIYDIPLFLRFGQKYTFGIRFECTGHVEEKERRYNLNIRRYDDIEIAEI